ncbi:acyltransferase [Parashewanella spongiae]|uniref:Acyltransferase n=1 Tax=Parashewanella spongiae TaxID=342950 RepID=A0A3A6TWN9_9GAMM|nr:lysophospholipid acyltransferase family protein [Parashewanella spongiae]MCL1077133.1 lysophospholipid acyltransferase family protein [Parashewanella spongiae]RJY18843.1 acyltransferase [Parashewanella spongiae]
MLTRFSFWLFHQLGWSFKGTRPTAKKYVMIAAPHTSNWDFVIGILARTALGEKIHFLGKHTLFIPPWGWLFRAIGGSPVDRRKNNNLVDTAVTIFNQRDEYKLALAPEGTRKAVTHWKMGFYRIAHKANVPIVCIGFDFENKKIVFADAIQTTGNIERDMSMVYAFYQNIKGRHPKDIPEFHIKK